MVRVRAHTAVSFSHLTQNDIHIHTEWVLSSVPSGLFLRVPPDKWMGVVANRGFILFDVHLQQWNKWRESERCVAWLERAVVRSNWLNRETCVANKYRGAALCWEFANQIREDCASLVHRRVCNSLMCSDQRSCESPHVLAKKNKLDHSDIILFRSPALSEHKRICFCFDKKWTQ